MKKRVTVLLMLVFGWCCGCEQVSAAGNQERLDEQVRAFEEQYSLEVVAAGHPFNPEFDKISGSDSAKAREYLPVLLAEFNLYPPAFVKRSGLKKIVICKDLAYDKQFRAAVPGLTTGIMYYDAERGGTYDMYRRAVIHHEYFHLIDWKDDAKLYVDEQWAKLNPADFNYGRGGVHVQGDATQGLTFDRLGFMNKYSMQGVEEDKAEVFAYLITESEMMEKRIKSDSVIAAKVKMMKQLMNSFSDSMDDAFWENTSSVKRIGARPRLTPIASETEPNKSEPSVNPESGKKSSAESSEAAVKQWHTHTLSSHGPETSESATPNPFTDYRLNVTFKNADVSFRVRGFFAAVGNAAESGADSGNVWQVRFAPKSWQATERRGSRLG